MNYQFTSRHLTLINLSRSDQGHMTFKRLYLINGASLNFAWNAYDVNIVNHMIFQFTPWHLTLGGIERSNQGHWVFIGLCIIDNVLLDSRAVGPRGLLFHHQVELPTRGYSSPTLGALVYSAALQKPECRAFRCNAALLVTAPRI